MVQFGFDWGKTQNPELQTTTSSNPTIVCLRNVIQIDLFKKTRATQTEAPLEKPKHNGQMINLASKGPGYDIFHGCPAKNKTRTSRQPKILWMKRMLAGGRDRREESPERRHGQPWARDMDLMVEIKIFESRTELCWQQKGESSIQGFF